MLAGPQTKNASKTSTKSKATQRKFPNLIGIPDVTKQRFENLSGLSFDDVRVHYNSSKPAQLQAPAYTQGNQVYVAPGQEMHLRHELGHVVQQKQGRVSPTTHINGIAINDDATLEREAIVLSGDTANLTTDSQGKTTENKDDQTTFAFGSPVQMMMNRGYQPQTIFYPNAPGGPLVCSDDVGYHSWMSLNGNDAIPVGTNTHGTLPGLCSYLRSYNAPFSFVQGHVLSAALGGGFINDNIFPITSTQNSHHYWQLENEAIALCNMVTQTGHPGNSYRYDCWFNYPFWAVSTLNDLNAVVISGTIAANINGIPYAVNRQVV
jgi:hypothetical protein